MPFIECLDKSETEATFWGSATNSKGDGIRRKRTYIAELNDLVENFEDVAEIQVWGENLLAGRVKIDTGFLKSERSIRIDISFSTLDDSISSSSPDARSWNVEFVAADRKIKASHIGLNNLTLGGTGDVLWGNLSRIEGFYWKKCGPPPSPLYRPEMKYAEIAGEEISLIPEGISVCRELETLSITGTSATKLPEDISDLPCLRDATLTHNLLTSCPPLRKTQSVFLEQNRLRAIPDWMAEIASRRNSSPPSVLIDLNGNPVSADAAKVAFRIPNFNLIEDDLLQEELRIEKISNGRTYRLQNNLISRVPPWMITPAVVFAFQSFWGKSKAAGSQEHGSMIYHIPA